MTQRDDHRGSTRQTGIALVLFDFDHVLAHYDHGLRIASLADATGASAARVAAVLFESGLETEYDSGLIDTDTYLARLGAGLGATVDRATWIAARVAGSVADEGVLALAVDIAQQMPIGVLTNNGALLADAARTIVAPLYPALEGRVLCSGALAVRKPDPRIFQLAVAHFGVEADQVLFVDDVFQNVQAARTAGLRAEQVTNAATLTRALQAHGLR